VVEADDVAGAEAPEVDGLAELAVQDGALVAGQPAGDEDRVERVALFEGEEDGVLREGVGVGMAEARRGCWAGPAPLVTTSRRGTTIGRTAKYARGRLTTPPNRSPMASSFFIGNAS
jgi:hypothetical protein